MVVLEKETRASHSTVQILASEVRLSSSMASLAIIPFMVAAQSIAAEKATVGQVNVTDN
jgi:hypothetical protein